MSPLPGPSGSSEKRDLANRPPSLESTRDVRVQSACLAKGAYAVAQEVHRAVTRQTPSRMPRLPCGSSRVCLDFVFFCPGRLPIKRNDWEMRAPTMRWVRSASAASCSVATLAASVAVAPAQTLQAQCERASRGRSRTVHIQRVCQNLSALAGRAGTSRHSLNSPQHPLK